MANIQELTGSDYVKFEESFVNFYEGKTIETTSLSKDAEYEATQGQKSTARRRLLGEEIDETSLSDSSDYETAEEDSEKWKRHEISFNDQMKPGAASTPRNASSSGFHKTDSDLSKGTEDSKNDGTQYDTSPLCWYQLPSKSSDSSEHLWCQQENIPDVENPGTCQKTATGQFSLGDETDNTSFSDSSDYHTAEEDPENDFNDLIKPSSPSKVTPSGDYDTDSALNKGTEDSKNDGTQCHTSPLCWNQLPSKSFDSSDHLWCQQESIPDVENARTSQKTASRRFSLGDETDVILLSDYNTDSALNKGTEDSKNHGTQCHTSPLCWYQLPSKSFDSSDHLWCQQESIPDVENVRTSQKTATGRFSLGDETDVILLSDYNTDSALNKGTEDSKNDGTQCHTSPLCWNQLPSKSSDSSEHLWCQQESIPDVENARTSQKTASRRLLLGDETDDTSFSDSLDYDTAEEDPENDFNDLIKPSSPSKVTPSGDYNTDSALNKETEDSENYGKHCFKSPLRWYRLSSKSSDSSELWWYQLKSISDDENDEIQRQKTTTRRYSLGDETDDTSLSDPLNLGDMEEDLETAFNHRMKFRGTSTPKKITHSGDHNQFRLA